MWSLHSLANPSTVYYLPSARDYTIGRKDCDITIVDDQSISRKHAVIKIKTDSVQLEDLSSKFGTEINRNRITTQQTVCHNDVIKFGQGLCSYRLLNQKLSICCSNMSADQKRTVRQLVQQLEGTMVSNWLSSCTHLVMTAVTVTVKVVNALSSCRPIVTISWLQEAIQCIKDKRILPPTNNYIPELVDSNLVDENCSILSLKPNLERRKLFNQKHIYFLSEKQHSTLQYCLRAASGTTHLINNDAIISSDQLCNENTLVIHPGGHGSGEILLERVYKLIQEAGLRLIPESEIGYAILQCSTLQYCNPRIASVSSQLPSQLPAPSLSQQSLPLHTTSLLCTQETEQSNASVLAYNTELSTQDIPNTRTNVTDQEELKVDETLIKQEITSNPLDSLFETDDQLASSSVLPSVQQTSTRQPSAQQTNTKQPSIQQTSTRQSSVQQTTTRQSSVQQTTTRQSSVQQTSTRQSSVQQTSTRQSSVQQTNTEQVQIQSNKHYELSNDTLLEPTTTQQSNATILAPDSFQEIFSHPVLSIQTPPARGPTKRQREEQIQTEPLAIKKTKHGTSLSSTTQTSTPVTSPASKSVYLSTRKEKVSTPKTPFQTETQNTNISFSLRATSSNESTSVTQTGESENPLPRRSMFEGLKSQRTHLKAIKEGHSIRLVTPQEYEEFMAKKETEGNEHDSNSEEMSRQSSPKYDPILNENGFICARKRPKKHPETLMQSSEDSSQPPTAHVMIESLSLLKPKDLDDVEVNVVHCNDTRNFKKFRKVIHPHSRSSINRIIGGEDLKEV